MHTTVGQGLMTTHMLQLAWQKDLDELPPSIWLQANRGSLQGVFRQTFVHLREVRESAEVAFACTSVDECARCLAHALS